MKRTYTMFQQHIACVLLISLFLQSCGGVNNTFIPIQDEKIELIDYRQLTASSTSIKALVDKELTAEGGYAVTFYEGTTGEIKASVEIVDEKDKIYNELPISIEKGVDIANLPYLTKNIQQNRILVKFDEKGQPIGIALHKPWLMGGMKAVKGPEKEQIQKLLEQAKQEKREKAIEIAGRALYLALKKNYKDGVTQIISDDYLKEGRFSLIGHALKLMSKEDVSSLEDTLESIDEELLTGGIRAIFRAAMQENDSDTFLAWENNLTELYDKRKSKPYHFIDVLSFLLNKVVELSPNKDAQKYFKFLADHTDISPQLLRSIKEQLQEKSPTENDQQRSDNIKGLLAIVSDRITGQQETSVTGGDSEEEGEYTDKNKFPINTKAEYDENMILMVWDSYVKSQENLQYSDGVQIFNSLFNKSSIEYGSNSMAPIKQSGLLIKIDNANRVYINKLNKSVSICGPINNKPNSAEDVVTANLRVAIEQIKQWNNHQNETSNKIKDHIIIFPYHITRGHWALGILQIKLDENNKLEEAKVRVFNPLPDCGGRRISKKAYNDIQALFAEIFESSLVNLVSEESEYNKQQDDGTSCGVISAENGKYFMVAESIGNVIDDLLKQTYPYGAENLRHSHIQEVRRKDFYQAQFNKPQQDPKFYIPSNYEELKSNFFKEIESLEASNKQEILQIIEGINNNTETNVAIKIKTFIKEHQGNFKSVLSLFDTSDEDWKFKDDHFNTLVSIIYEYNSTYKRGPNLGNSKGNTAKKKDKTYVEDTDDKEKLQSDLNKLEKVKKRIESLLKLVDRANLSDESEKPSLVARIIKKLKCIGLLMREISWKEVNPNCIRNKHGYRNRHKDAGLKKNEKGAKLDFETLAHLRDLDEKLCSNSLIGNLKLVRSSLEIIQRKVDFILFDPQNKAEKQHNADISFLRKMAAYYHDVRCIRDLLTFLESIKNTYDFEDKTDFVKVGFRYCYHNDIVDKVLPLLCETERSIYSSLKLSKKIDRYWLGYFFKELGETAKQVSDYISYGEQIKDIKAVFVKLGHYRQKIKNDPSIIYNTQEQNLYKIKEKFEETKGQLEKFLHVIKNTLARYSEKINDYNDIGVEVEREYKNIGELKKLKENLNLNSIVGRGRKSLLKRLEGIKKEVKKLEEAQERGKEELKKLRNLKIKIKQQKSGNSNLSHATTDSKSTEDQVPSKNISILKNLLKKYLESFPENFKETTVSKINNFSKEDLLEKQIENIITNSKERDSLYKKNIEKLRKEINSLNPQIVDLKKKLKDPKQENSKRQEIESQLSQKENRRSELKLQLSLAAALNVKLEDYLLKHCCSDLTLVSFLQLSLLKLSERLENIEESSNEMDLPTIKTKIRGLKEKLANQVEQLQEEKGKQIQKEKEIEEEAKLQMEDVERSISNPQIQLKSHISTLKKLCHEIRNLNDMVQENRNSSKLEYATAMSMGFIGQYYKELIKHIDQLEENSVFIPGSSFKNSILKVINTRHKLMHNDLGPNTFSIIQQVSEQDIRPWTTDIGYLLGFFGSKEGYEMLIRLMPEKDRLIVEKYLYNEEERKLYASIVNLQFLLRLVQTSQVLEQSDQILSFLTNKHIRPELKVECLLLSIEAACQNGSKANLEIAKQRFQQAQKYILQISDKDMREKAKRGIYAGYLPVLLFSYNFREAENLLNQMLKMGYTSKMNATLYTHLAFCAERKSQYMQSTEFLKQACAQPNIDIHQLIAINNFLSVSYIEFGQFVLARDAIRLQQTLINSHINLLRDSVGESGERLLSTPTFLAAWLLYSEGVCTNNKKLIKSSIEKYEGIEKIMLKLHPEAILTERFNYKIGRSLLMLGEFDQAQVRFNDAILETILSDKEEIVNKVKNVLGCLVYNAILQLSKAHNLEDIYEKYSYIYKRHSSIPINLDNYENELGLIKILKNLYDDLAILYVQEGKLQDAKEVFMKAELSIKLIEYIKYRFGKDVLSHKDSNTRAQRNIAAILKDVDDDNIYNLTRVWLDDTNIMKKTTDLCRILPKFQVGFLDAVSSYYASGKIEWLDDTDSEAIAELYKIISFLHAIYKRDLGKDLKISSVLSNEVALRSIFDKLMKNQKGEVKTNSFSRAIFDIGLGKKSFPGYDLIRFGKHLKIPNLYQDSIRKLGNIMAAKLIVGYETGIINESTPIIQVEKFLLNTHHEKNCFENFLLHKNCNNFFGAALNSMATEFEYHVMTDSSLYVIVPNSSDEEELEKLYLLIADRINQVKSFQRVGNKKNIKFEIPSTDLTEEDVKNFFEKLEINFTSVEMKSLTIEVKLKITDNNKLKRKVTSIILQANNG